MKKYSSLLQIHVSVFLFGFAGLFGKWIQLDALSIVWGRVLFASFAFLLFFLFKRISFYKIPLKSLFSLALLGGLLAFHWWSFFLAIQLSNVALGLLSFASFPVFTALMEPLFFRIGWNVKTLALVLLSSMGLYIILPEWDWQSDYMQGVFWGILSGLSFAILTLFNKKYQEENQLPKSHKSLLISFYQDFFALLILSAFIGFGFAEWNVFDWSQLLLLGVVFTALAHFLYINGLKNEKATTASLASNLEPVYGIFFAFLLLGEQIEIATFIGGVLILLASVFSAFETKK